MIRCSKRRGVTEYSNQDVRISDESVKRCEPFCCPNRSQDVSDCLLLDAFLSLLSLIDEAWIGYLYAMFNYTEVARNTKCVTNPVRSTASISSNIDRDFPFPQ